MSAMRTNTGGNEEKPALPENFRYPREPKKGLLNFSGKIGVGKILFERFPPRRWFMVYFCDCEDFYFLDFFWINKIIERSIPLRVKVQGLKGAPDRLMEKRDGSQLALLIAFMVNKRT